MADLGIRRSIRTRRCGKRATSRASPKRCGKSGEDLVATSASSRAWTSSTSAAATARRLFPLRRLAPGCSASTSPPIWSRPAMRAPAPPASTNLRFQEGDARNSRPRRRQLRPRRQHLRRHVRAAPVRRRPRDGARHQARRPHRHGQLDPRRPHPGRADPEDQRRLHAAAARRLRQPDDLGRREQVRERFEAAGIAPENVSFERATWFFRPRAAVRAPQHLPPLLRADDERLRGGPKTFRDGRAGSRS